METVIVIIITLVWLAVAVAAIAVGVASGAKAAVGFVGGLILGVLGGMLLYVVLRIRLKECPFCYELIRKRAVVCRYCRRDIPPPAT
jgi:hypothetical protein